MACRPWVILLLFVLFPSPANPQPTPKAGPETIEAKPDPAMPPVGTPSDDLGKFVARVLGSTEVLWKQIFEQSGRQYRNSTVVLFTGVTRAGACGVAQSAMGPFYCPSDEKIYLDPSFFGRLERRLNACDVVSSGCKFAQAYLIAHEVGHHVQNQLGILPKVQQQIRGLSKTEANPLQLRLEFQADCFAGVWASKADQQWRPFEPGEVDAGIKIAVRDNPAQGHGELLPEGLTSPEQRERWFQTGFKRGTIEACDTFSAVQP